MNKCEDLMTDYPLLCLPSDPVGKVAKLLSHPDTDPVLIIESEQTRRLAGKLTQQDLALMRVATGRELDTTKVADVMSDQVVSCRVGDDAQHAFHLMHTHQLQRIPVIDYEDRIVGILERTDLSPHFELPHLTGGEVRGVLTAGDAAAAERFESY